MKPLISYTIYQAPMQGFTDHVFRRLHHKYFGTIAKYFIPYITSENDGSIRRAKMKEILPENNMGIHAVPQILPATKEEATELCRVAIDNGYSEINLNLGCPFPMAVNKGKGCGLLLQPGRIDGILDAICRLPGVKISVKTRTGQLNHDELKSVIPVLNNYPLEEVIIHPRIGKQLYKGEAYTDIFPGYKDMLKCPAVYNGDITTHNFATMLAGPLKNEKTVMIGRGILCYPFLGHHMNNLPIDNAHQTQIKFLHELIAGYTAIIENEIHVLNRIQSQFEYYGDWFPAELKIRKKVKKARKLSEVLGLLH